ncbi:MAG: anaerobic ribonucleoside-triphosphate reductase activating protein [Treponema sp.]|jgi:pyruvate formate lyase activating enzyme|nr:anaerobic ribonucleoside-triphosphate reductase activating protein [Treponema sp.]
MPANILLRKTSFIDYPGRVSTVLFFTGCNLHCPWCHNRELLTGEAYGLVGAEEALAHISKRQSVLGGVVLSGGEPCLQEELPDIIREIKKLSLPVKLDTNGIPLKLEKLLSKEETIPDYIALDLKIAPSRYAELLPDREKDSESNGSGNADFNPGEALKQNAALICRSGIAHEYRTLALPGGFITEKDVEALAPLAGSSPWYFRPFRGGNCFDPAWDKLEELESEARKRAEILSKKARELGKNGGVTGWV